MKWIKVAVILVGLGHVIWGTVKLRSGGPTKPVEVKLADIESGNRPKSDHWRITDYYSRTDATVVETLTSDQSVVSRHYYYPIFSGKRPVIEAKALANFAVLVYSRDFDELKGIDEPLEGVVGTGVLSLSGRLRSDLGRMFPNLDESKVIVFRKGLKPPTRLTHWIVLGLGVVIIIAGVWLMFDRQD